MIDIDARSSKPSLARCALGVVDDARPRRADAADTDAAAIAARPSAQLPAGTAGPGASIGTCTRRSSAAARHRSTSSGHGHRSRRSSSTARGPHDIRAHGRVLAFAGPPAGFATAVHHPGTAPDPFVARGLSAIGGDIAAAGDSAADHLAADVAARLTEG
jgi:hypothetical protein